jgi:hypothetical protein
LVTVEVTRTEFAFVFILLLLNTLSSYSIYRRFERVRTGMRYSVLLLIVSLLLLCTWIVRVFVFDGSLASGSERITGAVWRLEILLVFVLILANILRHFSLFESYRRVEPFIVMSAYSKKVRWKNEWITIEEYLLREFGIEVSHGITPEEKEEALAEFRRELAEKEEESGEEPASVRGSE